MSPLQLRPTLPEDMAIVSKDRLPYRLRFLTMLNGDEVIGVGGFVFRTDGTVWISAYLTPAARKAPVTLHRAGLRILNEARRRDIRQLFALADPTQPRSEAWLQRCGFLPTDMSEAGRRVWMWTSVQIGVAQ